MDKLYIRIRGRVHGPLSEAQIMQMIQQGKAGKFNEVSTDGKTWKRATEFPELFPQKVTRNDGGDLLLADDSPGGSAAAGDALWYLSNDGITGTGPFSLGEIQSMLASGKATRDSFVWREGEGARPLNEVPQFRGTSPETKKSAKPQEESAEKKYCNSCNRAILNDAAFCPYCGTSQKAEAATGSAASPFAGRVTCKSCRFILEAGVPFCPKCGAAQESDTPKSRVVYILLALLVLGGFGAHNFYAQRKSTAARQLVLGLTLVGFSISLVWAWIDAFSVREDGMGIPFKDD